MTPLKLQILLHIYTRGSLPELWSTVPADALRELLEVRAVEPTPNGYCTTALGKAWVEEILATPLPRLQYVGASGNVYPGE